MKRTCKACRDANKNGGNQKNNDNKNVNQNKNDNKIYKWVAAVAVSIVVVATGINFIPDKNEPTGYENTQSANYSKDDNKITNGDNGKNENNIDKSGKSQVTKEALATKTPDATKEAPATDTPDATEEPQDTVTDYTFRSNKHLVSHYEKHGIEMGFASAEEYQSAASAVVNNPDALHKLEAEDGDDVYYLEGTNEFVIVSPDGYIRTYFLPDAGKDYYDRQ